MDDMIEEAAATEAPGRRSRSEGRGAAGRRASRSGGGPATSAVGVYQAVADGEAGQALRVV